jgi:CheY-like chemotaxis protein
LKKIKILIVDDEVAFTNVVKLTLEMNNHYKVCVENNPLLAISMTRKFEPDIILLDVIMPELDGGELYMQLKADTLTRHIPIIFLTAIVRREDVDSNNGMIGGRSYIAKPVNAEELIKAIEETAGKAHKREPRRKVKNEVVAYLEKFSQGSVIEIASLTGLKVASVQQTLNRLRKSGHVLRDKKHGSPFVLAKK